jgi:hypothetical protein
MRIDSPITASSAGSRRAAGAFQITWQRSGRWHINNASDVPILAARDAIAELVTRDNGRSFLLPSLEQAAGFKIAPERLDRNLSISMI